MADQPDLTKSSSVTIGLNAVIAIVDDGTPKTLCVRDNDSRYSLPYGPFDPARHRTFEIGLKDWVERQTNVRLGFIEQLYTFGDKGRAAPAALIAGGAADARIVSVGYLALANEAADIARADTIWKSWYDCFPWEDWRRGEPAVITETILPGLKDWTTRGVNDRECILRKDRTALTFGLQGVGWEEERALDRYELMYEAGLVEEAWRDRAAAGLPEPRTDPAATRLLGAAMASDHRRILATAIGRLRGKLKYRAVVFELMPRAFTLLALQRTVEAIVGFQLHKQNFRRSVEGSGLVERTDEMVQQPSGRPAALFNVSGATKIDRAARGLAIPRLRQSPAFKL
ncbi:MAG: NAD regulator [Pseudomonadota bacterium]